MSETVVVESGCGCNVDSDSIINGESKVDHSPRVLSIQSHVVSGYVGNKCAVFPLQALGFEVDFINSVQFSNHTGYGKWKGQVLMDTDLDDLYQGLVDNELVNYSHLLTGYVGTVSFLQKIQSVVASIKKKLPNCVYLCDPVLGDNGHFYVPEALIPVYTRDVLPLADITTPNTFELELFSGMKIVTETDALLAMDKIHDLGVKIVVLSSLDSAGADLDTYASVRSESGTRRVWKTTSPRLDDIFTGTGDLFAALFLGWYHKLGAENIPEVLRTTLATMQVVLRRTKEYAEAHPKVTTNPTGRPIPKELRLVQSLDVILNPPLDDHVVTEIPIKLA
ncbi:putative pyridoxal kinase [Folsomia candida]|uniref:Pyridoxal kinase n=1 Tax=Folsomia candida TaxID=158441 RepID=A0A226DYD1_FOLCA|nr:putative pyridoxal kinase [Folsomia candida]OXA50070.1 putative pyridoxal kinase [Folsomia candida]